MQIFFVSFDVPFDIAPGQDVLDVRTLTLSH